MKARILLVLLILVSVSFVALSQQQSVLDQSGNAILVWTPKAIYAVNVNIVRTKLTRLSGGRANFGAWATTGHFAGVWMIRIDYHCLLPDFPVVPDSISILCKFNGGMNNVTSLSVGLTVLDSLTMSWYYFGQDCIITPNSANWNHFTWNMTPVRNPGVNWHGIQKLGEVILSFQAETSDSTNTGFDTEAGDFDFIYNTEPQLRDFGLISTGVEGVEQVSGQNPKGFVLEQNYPNPFNPSTTINYSVPKTSFVTLKVYNVLGKEIATLVDGQKTSGNYEVTFNASNLPSGTYFCRLSTGTTVETRKMLLVK